MKIWLNKTYSSVHSAIELIRKGDAAREFEIYFSHPNPHSLAGAVADRFELEPDHVVGADYVAWCLDFVQRHGIDIFLPGKEAMAIGDARATFEAIGCRVLGAGDPAMLRRIDRKADFYADVICPEAPPAEWRAVHTLAEFDAAHADLRSRHTNLCIKPSVSIYGIGFRRIREDRTAYDLYASGSDFQIDLDGLRRLLGTRDHFPSLLLMEYLDGHEYSVDTVADHGRLRCAVARRKPLKSGDGQLIDNRADIQQACARMVSQFGLNGLINIQFKEGGGRLRVLEINARMSGGLAMACLAGPNLPWLAVAGFAHGFDGLTIPPTEAGLRVGERNVATLLR